MLDFTKIFFAQAEKSCAIKFRVAAYIVIRVRMQDAAIRAAPLFLCVISSFHVYRSGIPVLFLARHIRPALDQEDALPTRRKFPGEGTAACAAADDDEIVMPIIHTAIRRHECRILTRSFCVRSPGANRRIPDATKFSDECPNRRHSSARLLFPRLTNSSRK